VCPSDIGLWSFMKIGHRRISKDILNLDEPIKILMNIVVVGLLLTPGLSYPCCILRRGKTQVCNYHATQTPKNIPPPRQPQQQEKTTWINFKPLPPHLHHPLHP
jgi:hypothetical protein